MGPVLSIVFGIILNVSAVLAMEEVRLLWKGAPPAFPYETWVLYALIALTIVGAQFCIIQAGLSNDFPMYVAIGIFIAFVLTFATLNGCRASGRWPTLAEGVLLVALISVAFLLQYVSSSAERAHQERVGQTATQPEA
jgi:hypothetical protein